MKMERQERLEVCRTRADGDRKRREKMNGTNDRTRKDKPNPIRAYRYKGIKLKPKNYKQSLCRKGDGGRVRSRRAGETSRIGNTSVLQIEIQ